MDVKEAAYVAKEHIIEIFSDELIADVGLEEIERVGRFRWFQCVESNRWVFPALGSARRRQHYPGSNPIAAFLQSADR